MKILDTINSPLDLKKLNNEELDELSKEIRLFLVNNISKTGGHLSSNLGVVELTLSIHKVFNSPTDKIIWDVGHQAYVHKLVTGRKNNFNSIRTFNGMSGFPKSSESIHDHFDTGHSATSISAGVGYAVARDIKGLDNKVISIIGDGSMTSGMAFEAINNAGRLDTDLIVILNDNQMSISENVGAMSNLLNNVRISKSYNDLKKNVRDGLNSIPTNIGDNISRVRDAFKSMLINEGLLFEELGFKYIGPVDGHNIKHLNYVFENVKNIKGPVLVHVYTKKGKGYKKAEQSPEKFHGISSFDTKTGEVLKSSTAETYSDVFGEKLVELATQNKNIVAITAAMTKGCGLSNFSQKFSNRIFDVGIAEEHAITFSAGLAKEGLIPVVTIYSTFLQRAYDQIIHDVCIQNLHVIIAIDRAGIVGEDGETHQGIFDISFLSHIPNLTFIAPMNKKELELSLEFAVNHNGPIAIRYPRGQASLLHDNIVTPIEYGKSLTIYKGSKIAIVNVGTMLKTCDEIIEELKNYNINATLINARFINPIDESLIDDLLSYEYIYTIEDNLINGGYGNKLLNKLINLNWKGAFKNFGFDDTFVQHGDLKSLYKINKLDKESILNEIVLRSNITSGTN